MKVGALCIKKGVPILTHPPFDIIAKKDDIIRFIEVKFRGSDSYGSALEAVDFRKQRRIMRAASWFLNEYGLNDVQCSFDVMTVENNEARYYFNCYGGI